jgi:F-type H+-transporting ATPase subunit b
MRPSVAPFRCMVRRVAGTSVALGLSLLSSVAFAAEGNEGMPQLNFATPLTTSQVVWLAVIFLALYLLLSNWALPKVGEVLEMRAAVIAADLDAARGAKMEADAAVDELSVATRKAQAEAQAEIAGAVATAKQAAATQAAAANDRLSTQLATAEKQIAAARTAALGALREVATVTASDVVARLTGQAVDTGAIDRAVGSALAARGHA